MPSNVSFKCKITMEHEEGPERDADWLLDYFAAAVGKGNGARPPLKLVLPDSEGGSEFGGVDSVYVVGLVEDA